jgi:hypothetical protein
MWNWNARVLTDGRDKLPNWWPITLVSIVVGVITSVVAYAVVERRHVDDDDAPNFYYVWGGLAVLVVLVIAGIVTLFIAAIHPKARQVGFVYTQIADETVIPKLNDNLRAEESARINNEAVANGYKPPGKPSGKPSGKPQVGPPLPPR